jgi:hypothetical protein
MENTDLKEKIQEVLWKIPYDTVLQKPINAKIKLPENNFFDTEFLNVHIVSKQNTSRPCSGYGLVYLFRSDKEIEGKDSNSIAWGFREEGDQLLMLILVGKLEKIEDSKQLYDKMEGFLLPIENIVFLN